MTSETYELELQDRAEKAEAEVQKLRAAFLKIRARSWPGILGGCWCRNPNTTKHTQGCEALREAFEELPDEEW